MAAVEVEATVAEYQHLVTTEFQHQMADLVDQVAVVEAQVYLVQEERQHKYLDLDILDLDLAAAQEDQVLLVGLEAEAVAHHKAVLILPLQILEALEEMEHSILYLAQQFIMLEAEEDVAEI
jgi:hypothetical protein